MTEECSFCGHGRLAATTSRYIHQQRDDILIVDDVPCLRCGHCGEGYFDIATLKKIDADHAALSAAHTSSGLRHHRYRARPCEEPLS